MAAHQDQPRKEPSLSVLWFAEDLRDVAMGAYLRCLPTTRRATWCRAGSTSPLCATFAEPSGSTWVAISGAFLLTGMHRGASLGTTDISSRIRAQHNDGRRRDCFALAGGFGRRAEHVGRPSETVVVDWGGVQQSWASINQSPGRPFHTGSVPSHRQRQSVSPT